MGLHVSRVPSQPWGRGGMCVRQSYQFARHAGDRLAQQTELPSVDRSATYVAVRNASVLRFLRANTLGLVWDEAAFLSAAATELAIAC